MVRFSLNVSPIQKLLKTVTHHTFSDDEIINEAIYNCEWISMTGDKYKWRWYNTNTYGVYNLDD